MEMTYLILAYLLFISLDGFLIMAIDKQRAEQERRRVPEALIFLIAAIGGSAGVLAAMYTFRHKTKHTSFTVGIPLIIFAQVCLAVILMYFLK